jgi:hypothetical protein
MDSRGAIHELTRIRHEIRRGLFVEVRVFWWIVVLLAGC